MTFFHGHPAAAIANISHGRQFVLANMFAVHLRCTAKAALGSIPTGIAQMTGFSG
jgi:hypothetical protein